MKNKVLRGFNIIDIMYEYTYKKYILKDYNDTSLFKDGDCNSKVIVVTARNIEITDNISAEITYFIMYGLKYGSLLYLKDDYLEKTITNFFA